MPTKGLTRHDLVDVLVELTVLFVGAIVVWAEKDFGSLKMVMNFWHWLVLLFVFKWWGNAVG